MKWWHWAIGIAVVLLIILFVLGRASANAGALPDDGGATGGVGA